MGAHCCVLLFHETGNPQAQTPQSAEKVSADDCFFPEENFPLLYGALEPMTAKQLAKANKEFTPPSPSKADRKLALLKTAAKRHAKNDSYYGMDVLLSLGTAKVKEALEADGALDEWVDFVELFESADAGKRLAVKAFAIDAAHCPALFACFAEMTNKQLEARTTKADRAEHAEGKATKDALTRCIIATAARRQAEKLPSAAFSGRLTRSQAKKFRHFGELDELLAVMTAPAKEVLGGDRRGAHREWAMAVKLKWFGETARKLEMSGGGGGGGDGAEADAGCVIA